MHVQHGRIASLLSLIFGGTCFLCSVVAVIGIVCPVSERSLLAIPVLLCGLFVCTIGIPLAMAATILGLIGRSRSQAAWDEHMTRSTVFSILGIIGGGFGLIAAVLVFFGG